LFTGVEKDEETGFYAMTYRYYDARMGVFISVDPLLETKNWMPAYGYCGNNPIIFLDPDGLEKIVASGGEYEGRTFKYDFIEPAIKQLKNYKKNAGEEPVTWAVMTAGYSDDDISNFKGIADELGVGFQAINSADEFTNYLNSKNVENSNLSTERIIDQITEMSIFGHGVPGAAEFAYRQGQSQDVFSWSTKNIKQLDPSAFFYAQVDFYTCNSATNKNGESVAGTFSRQTNSATTGFQQLSDYAGINAGQGVGDRIWARALRGFNGFNPNGSKNLPTEGQNATRHKYYPKRND
jgi:RHS repeat-associated protein